MGNEHGLTACEAQWHKEFDEDRITGCHSSTGTFVFHKTIPANVNRIRKTLLECVYK